MARKKNPDEMSEGSDGEDDFDYGEEPDFADPEDYVDDVDDEELMPEIMKTQPRESDGVDSVIVVDGVPNVAGERVEKLKNVIRKIYSKFGKLVNEHYPVSEDGSTKGYIFLEFSSHANAVEAVKSTNNYKLDKLHTFVVNLFSDFDKYETIPDEWEAPHPQEYKDQGNLRSWLLESDAADQFSVIHKGGEEVSVFVNNNPDPVEIQTRPRWTETYVKWSPLGTYLATFHTRGIALWGGEDFHQISKFSHPGVQFIEFSPCEKYLVTFSPSSINVTEDPSAIIIWDSRTGAKKRAFHSENPPVWPVFKWSSDDKYFARMTQDSTLSVYETPSFGLLDKKSIKVEYLKGFSWSPKDPILAYWVAEDKDVPARVVLMEIPSRKELRVKNLFNVADCKMHWQKSGEYLCVKVDRYKKILENKDIKYAGMYYNFEIFHMNEKQIPVDTVKIEESVHAFSWEPIGSKFAVIHGDSQSLNVSFYGLKKGMGPEVLKKYERKTANHIFWSPTGQFCIMAGLRGMNGVLEFVDTSDFTSMGGGEHFMCTDVEWDPTGRYVMTGVSWWGHKVDNAYWLWNFQGKVLKRSSVEKFCQLVWRPRPQSMLSKEQFKDIKKNLKKYSDQFNAKDKMRQSRASKELIAKRQALADAFNNWRDQKIREYDESREKRIELRGGRDMDDHENEGVEEETVEFLVKEESTILQD
eukprot:TRINITY_DN59919_c0_g1_i1.p1 TRINITY_DN59919_c0_g1~~TRINITY_DN59919_c0_g1_i1.p1  ORF type:complete len:696 (-),score=241.36 TRINITY_DN59919_c0_g1_i1:149-2236(-)